MYNWVLEMKKFFVLSKINCPSCNSKKIAITRGKTEYYCKSCGTVLEDFSQLK